MGFQLRDGIHWCDCDGRAIFLDVDADRYFCLPAAANDAFLQLARAERPGADMAGLVMLRRRSIIVEADRCAALQAPARIPPPTHDLAGEQRLRAGLALVARALASEMVCSRRLRTRSLRELIATAEAVAKETRVHRGDWRDRARAIARAADALTLLRSVRDRCLVRALAVYSLCGRFGVPAKLVFGVVAHPFSAHCWVQAEDAVLVGNYEQARLYTPILVVG